MKKGFKFIEGITIADVAFEAYGKNLDELFVNAAQALFEIDVDPSTVKAKKKIKLMMNGDSAESLLFNFLAEILVMKDSKGMVFNKAEVHVNEYEERKWRIEGVLYGDYINHKKQTLRVDAKAITMHHFQLKQEKNGYKAMVVVDI